MAVYDSVLIFDGECPYCSVAARVLEQIDDIGAISWYDDAAQAFLEVQFGVAPFAMVLVDVNKQRVYAGRATAKELAERAGMPSVVGSLVRDNYDTIAHVVGIASNRGRDPDDFHEEYRLSEDGEAAFDQLATNADDRTVSTTRT